MTWATRAALVSIAIAIAGCRLILGGDEFVDAPPVTDAPDPPLRIDLLFVIQNSRGMLDKQQILKLAVPDLVGRLVNPPCVGDAGYPADEQPADPSLPCPIDGTHRSFAPVRDLHVGMITSSLGGHGGDACDDVPGNDRGHLVARSSPDGGEPVYTYGDRGFLAWDPDAKLTPPGTANAQQLVANIDAMMGGPGAIGCGLEAHLESWYRFLADPEPYETLTVTDGVAAVEGINQVVLAQRKDFLRPDSLLVIVTLADQNDCSIIDGGSSWLVGQVLSSGAPFVMPPGRTECWDIGPDDPCCFSCAFPIPDEDQDGQPDCPPDPACNVPPYPEFDPPNLRCFNQKRRFGFDFLAPINRYVGALTSDTIATRSGDIVPNPVFVDGRAKEDVILVGIVGVPWQDVARRYPASVPNLLQGLDAHGEPVGGLQSASELAASGTWDVILGDPGAGVTPSDPFMFESWFPREGTNPITGDAITLPDATNPINGHEHFAADQLQFACVFDLPEPLDCVAGACVCASPMEESPLCQVPGTDEYSTTTQYRSGAFPGVRHLQVLKALGDRGVVGSVCPRQLDDDALADFGYRPVLNSLAERLQAR